MDSNKVPISVVLIVKNEEANLSECLESVKWAKEIVIVDGGSTDKTVQIAKHYTDKILVREMDVEGRHRNFAYQQASCHWLLSLDADERVSPELALEISRAVIQNDPDLVGHAIPIKTFIGKRWIKKAGYYPARKLRMYQKGKFRYEETAVHPRAYLDGREQPLKGDILHYGYRNFAHFIEKFNHQTSLEAEKWAGDSRTISAMKILWKSVDRFSRNYFGKQGFQDGFMGFVMSVFHGLYQLLTYAKYLESKNDVPKN